MGGLLRFSGSALRCPKVAEKSNLTVVLGDGGLKDRVTKLL